MKYEMAQRIELIDLGMGQPTDPTPPTSSRSCMSGWLDRRAIT